MAESNTLKWLIITTDNLPEAYVMAKYLKERSQELVIFNIKGRTLSQSIDVLKRLAKKRGIIYLIDFILGKKYKKYYQKPEVRIFPEITESIIKNLRSASQYFDLDDPHSENTINLVKKIKPDYILFLGAPVIKPSLFTLSRYGTINWHHGVSPLYRGSDCVLWAMARADFANIGFTIHYVTEVVDGGKIILQRKVPVRTDLDFSESLADIFRQGMNGFIQVVEDILLKKDINGKDQLKGGAHYPPVGLSMIRRACNNFHTYASNDNSS